MNYDIIWTIQFKKDYKLALKRHLDIDLLDDIIRALSQGKALPEKTKTMRILVIGQDIQSCSGQPTLEERFEFRKDLVQNVGQFHKLA